MFMTHTFARRNICSSNLNVNGYVNYSLNIIFSQIEGSKHFHTNSKFSGKYSSGILKVFVNLH